MKKVNNKENANNYGAEKAEEVSWVLFEFSSAPRPRKRRKLFNQSPFYTGSTLGNSFVSDEGKIIHLPLCKIIWHSWFKNIRACSSPKQTFRLNNISDFLMGTQKFFFFPRSWQDEKTSSLTFQTVITLQIISLGMFKLLVV